MVILDFLILFVYSAVTFISFKEEWYIGELAASLRMHWFLLGMLIALYYVVRRRYPLLLAGWALTLYHAPALASLMLAERPHVPASEHHTVRVFQHNTLRYKDNADEVMRWLSSHGDDYDIVFLQEVSPVLNERINELLPYYPYIVPTYYKQRFDNAVLSKYPITSFEIRMFPDLEIGYIRCVFSLDDGGGALTMYGMHATAPISPAYWHARNGQFAHIASEIENDTQYPRFMVGDLNLTPYSPIFASLLEISHLRSSMEGFGLENTWGSFLPTRMLGLPIDHLLFSDHISVKKKTVGPSLGSDHYSVTTVLAVPKGASPGNR